MLVLLAGEKDILGCLLKDTAEACNFDTTAGQGCFKSVHAEENEDATTRAMAVPGNHPARTHAGQCGDGCGLRGEDDAESAQPVPPLPQRSALSRGTSFLSWLPRGGLPLPRGRNRGGRRQAPGLFPHTAPVAQRGLSHVHG